MKLIFKKLAKGSSLAPHTSISKYACLLFLLILACWCIMNSQMKQVAR